LRFVGDADDFYDCYDSSKECVGDEIEEALSSPIVNHTGPLTLSGLVQIYKAERRAKLQADRIDQLTALATAALVLSITVIILIVAMALYNSRNPLRRWIGEASQNIRSKATHPDSLQLVQDE
jgi:hypothetical protein